MGIDHISQSTNPHKPALRYMNHHFFRRPISDLQLLPYSKLNFADDNSRDNSNKSPLEMLPNELIVKIIFLLANSPRDLINFSRVSTRIVNVLKNPITLQYDGEKLTWYPSLQLIQEAREITYRYIKENEASKNRRRLQHASVDPDQLIFDIMRNKPAENLDSEVILATLDDSEIAQSVHHYRYMRCLELTNKCYEAIVGKETRSVCTRSMLCTLVILLSIIMPLALSGSFGNDAHDIIFASLLVTGLLSVPLCSLIFSCCLFCFSNARLDCWPSCIPENPFEQFSLDRANNLNALITDDDDEERPLLTSQV